MLEELEISGPSGFDFGLEEMESEDSDIDDGIRSSVGEKWWREMVDNSCIYLEEKEEDQFFDSREEISYLSDSCCSNDEENFVGLVSEYQKYDIWLSSPVGIRERRNKLRRWMGLDPVQSPPRKECTEIEVERITSDGGAVLMSSRLENSLSTSSWSSNGSSEESFEFMIKSLDDGSVFVPDQFGDDGSLRSLREVGSDRRLTMDEFERFFGPSSFVQKLMQREINKSSNPDTTVTKRRKTPWLKKFGAVACIVDRTCEDIDSCVPDSSESMRFRTQRVRVRTNKKRSKEFSAVYTGQHIKAHEGAILTMKFSPVGQYLASGGEDGVVRVWSIVECDSRDEDIPEDDPSCVFFKVNDNLELAPLYLDKEKLKLKHVKTSETTCVVVPPEVFRVSEKPVHEFYGHDGDVLDLSWSKDKYLLSSSVDKTVRLWKVGYDSCLKVFMHNNFVTCVQFNPVNENYFVSGSIDGKIRIWELLECRVVDWTDIRDIVTALTYSLDGKGIVVGTMTGDCRFYDASDNQLKLEAQVSLQSKKKSPVNRITGFQYCPSDHQKLMVTSADSQIRILDGVSIVSKYKGLRNSGSQISASFTVDGKHIISASEDSSVYVWAHASRDPPKPKHVKSTWSSERFISNNVSVAIPWIQPKSRNLLTDLPQGNCSDSAEKNTTNLFSDFLPKTSATWPEEKLPLSLSSPMKTSALCKSHYKFLKASCRNSTHAWGQVIVTGGWDGRIQSFRNYGLPAVNQ